jgi:hypothetical protein
MAEEERRAVDNVGLLRALADQAMQENGLADAQGAAAVSVVPSTATAAAVGMDIGTTPLRGGRRTVVGGGGAGARRGEQRRPRGFQDHGARDRHAQKERIAPVQTGQDGRGGGAYRGAL